MNLQRLHADRLPAPDLERTTNIAGRMLLEAMQATSRAADSADAYAEELVAFAEGTGDAQHLLRVSSDAALLTVLLDAAVEKLKQAKKRIAKAQQTALAGLAEATREDASGGE